MILDKEKAKKYRQVLPDEIREIYDDPDTSDKIYDICVKYGVNHLDQIKLIGDAVYSLMLGLTKPSDVVASIISETGIGEDIVNLIIHDINDQILKPIHDKLIEHQRTLEGKSALPSNVEVEKDDFGFSSAPYQETKPLNKEQVEMISEIENPTPATYITRDNFTEKISGLHSSQKVVEKIDLSHPSIRSKEKDLPAPQTKTKIDPYREPI